MAKKIPLDKVTARLILAGEPIGWGIPLTDIKKVVRAEIKAKYGPNLTEAAAKMGISPQHLNNELVKDRTQKGPDLLLNELGYTTITFVVKARQ